MEYLLKMSNISKIKHLRSQLKDMIPEAEVLKNDYINRQKLYSNKVNQIKQIKKQIEDLENVKDIQLSEHAILRYLERVEGFDIDKIQNIIITEELKEQVETLGGNGVFPLGKTGNTIRLKNYTIVTII